MPDPLDRKDGIYPAVQRLMLAFSGGILVPSAASFYQAINDKLHVDVSHDRS
jgi:hypothetical protein